ncbi:MAG: endopeptidase La [SAR324 cluster bacterium]|nr:endopeptidase La [SAR324 cluster bacterium]
MDEYQVKETITLPMLPMRNIVVFPHMTTPFFIGRKQSIEALEKALEGDRQIFVLAQKDPMVENPEEDDLFEVGTVGNILQIMRLPNGTIKALFEAKDRGRRKKITLGADAYEAEVDVLQTVGADTAELTALIQSVRLEFRQFVKKVAKGTDSVEKITNGDQGAGELADLIAPLLTLEISKQQELLDEVDDQKRLETIYTRMLEEEEHKKLEQKLKERVQGQIGKSQKEYYLNEQMKAIQKEMGSEDSKEEFDEIEEKIEASAMSKVALEAAKRELKKLKMMPPMSSEANIVRTYLDWLVNIPWTIDTKDQLDIEEAQKILDEDHYALDKVKERIIEYIAVAKMVGSLRGPIICLVGPPGVGKTSLAKSIARSVNRTFVRMSLGGVRDEAEIRGHRRTYIGAMPGKILQSMKKAKTTNPVMLLDEIDKMGQSHMGDPASALLEVLDPEQNKDFMDHYFEVEYDLSDVMFICTANSRQDIPLPLIDRMEVIDLSGYTELEKEKISFKYLIPRQIIENGLKDQPVEFEQDGVLEVIRGYTREAGVRSLERLVAKLCRKIVTAIIKIPEDERTTIKIDKVKVHEFLGVPPFSRDKLDLKNEVGIVNGLAWTSVGGEVLTIEVGTMKGTGKISLTGKLGDVMKESAQAALSYIRSNANALGIYSKVFSDLDIHVHVPDGGTPKDGPSAGVAITSALTSALTGIPVRKDMAMTGEITLRGKILPIGGLKEKLLAAKRNHLVEVLIPSENEKDLAEIDDEIKNGLIITPLVHVKEVLKKILVSQPEPVDDADIEKLEEEKIHAVGTFSSENSSIKPS